MMEAVTAAADTAGPVAGDTRFTAIEPLPDGWDPYAATPG